MGNVFAEREKRSDEAGIAREMEEKRHLQFLINCEAGRWVLGSLLDTFEKGLRKKTTGHNSEDSYHRGAMDTTMKYRNLLIKHFGNAVIDTILKGSK